MYVRMITFDDITNLSGRSYRQVYGRHATWRDPKIRLQMNCNRNTYHKYIIIIIRCVYNKSRTFISIAMYIIYNVSIRYYMSLDSNRMATPKS